MKTWLAQLQRTGMVALVLFALGGCAGLPTPGTRLDAEGLHNAIVADDADYVRAAVAARWIDVNSSIPAPVYMEGTPLITIAARAGSVNVVRYLIASGADLNALTPAYEGGDSPPSPWKSSARSVTTRVSRQPASCCGWIGVVSWITRSSSSSSPRVRT